MRNNEVIETLQKWQLEANSGHNDGWTQKHYQDKIDEVADYLVETRIEHDLNSCGDNPHG